MHTYFLKLVKHSLYSNRVAVRDQNYTDLQNVILLLFLHLRDEISFQWLDTRRALILCFGSVTYVKTLGLKKTASSLSFLEENIVKNLSVIFTEFCTTYMEIAFPQK